LVAYVEVFTNMWTGRWCGYSNAVYKYVDREVVWREGMCLHICGQGGSVEGDYCRRWCEYSNAVYKYVDREMV